ncbi:MAG: NAD(P)-binding protein [Congregibacter sp.]
MSDKTDKQLGMMAKITRRDLVQGSALAAMGLALGANTLPTFADIAPNDPGGIDASAKGGPAYPPTATGLRGSHPGAFEVAHALARDGKTFAAPQDLDERYDLIIVGAGISGLAAAHFYRQRFGDDAKILLLENHDDFGGHARRNEFHQGGQMRLSLGGTHNLEWWSFSDTVQTYLRGLDVDTEQMLEKKQFNYGRTAVNGTATWFDQDTYGEDRLVAPCDLSSSTGLDDATVDQLPLSNEARDQLKRFFTRRSHVLHGLSEADAESHLRSMSYPQFLRQYAGLGDEAVQLFDKLQHGGWGLEMRVLSAMEALDVGLPGINILGKEPAAQEWRYPAAMWPDGNASLARLQLASLIPLAAPGTNAANVSLAQVDYARLDQPDTRVRLRLSATAIRAENLPAGVAVNYVKDDRVFRVQAEHCVMACYHAIIPHLCPQLPDAQQAAMRYQVKRPLLLTNVLIRNTRALDRLGIDAVHCPGRLHSRLFTFRGINTGGYQHDLGDSGPVSVVFWGSVSPPPDVEDVKSQHRASRAIMLGLSFEDYEREVRTVLDGLLGPAGFDVQNDVLAITVNRWPHGYSYDYLDLWDEDWPEGEAPHEIARRPFGNIVMANSDAAADAYTHAAIDQAARAVSELSL